MLYSSRWKQIVNNWGLSLHAHTHTQPPGIDVPWQKKQRRWAIDEPLSPSSSIYSFWSTSATFSNIWVSKHSNLSTFDQKKKSFFFLWLILYYYSPRSSLNYLSLSEGGVSHMILFNKISPIGTRGVRIWTHVHDDYPLISSSVYWLQPKSGFEILKKKKKKLLLSWRIRDESW